ncbi:DUF4129 domain-containing protein [Zhouia sp. PK063]|uniref:DUF4129 domain-containing protein n=1 Tax=Zhouia sp. PK063 TaxID=3373602 RepID=UPI003797FDD2
MISIIKYIIIACFLLVSSCGFAQQTEQLKDTIVKTDTTKIVSYHFKEHFKDQYKGDEYVYETEKLKGFDISKWITSLLQQLFSFKNPKVVADTVKIAVWIFLIVIIIMVVYFIVKAIMNKEGKWIFGKSSDKKIIKAIDVENNIQEADFATLIQNAIQNKEYRIAIRYYYLWLLKDFTHKELIIYDVEKTNSDYLLELKNETIKQQFNYASYLYNYIWYGEFPIDETQFNNAKKTFTSLIQSAK